MTGVFVKRVDFVSGNNGVVYGAILPLLYRYQCSTKEEGSLGMGKIGPGFRLGKLNVVSDTGLRKNGYTIWLCSCECGGTIQLDTRTLQRGTVAHCGCGSKVKPGQRELTGQKFGRLLVLEPTNQRGKDGAVIWRCKCDCGNEVMAVNSQLLRGYKKSCGCLKNPPLKDYVGRKFGKLTVISYAGKRNGLYRWQCRCECGKLTEVGQTSLQSGKTKSCGCLQVQMGKKNLQFAEGTSVKLLETVDKRLIKSNTSGYNGVYYNKRCQKWTAQITFKGKTHYLGIYSDIRDAVKARKNAEERFYGTFLDLYYDVK